MTKEIYLSKDDLPESIDSVSDPVVVESEELERLRQEADDDSQFEELQSSLDELGDIREEKNDLEDEVEEREARIEELEEQVEEIDDVKSMYAEELEAETPFDVEELMDFDLATLREKHESLDTSPVDDTDPDPQSGDIDEEELEESDEDDEVDEEIESLETKLEFYESKGWEANADSVQEELSELRGE